MNNPVERISGQVPIILPSPVIAMQQVESRIVVLTKFLSWLTATLLATAVIISLMSVTSERNNLRAQLSEQSVELACRSAASIVVNRAVGERDNSIAQALVYIAEGNTDFFKALVPTLQEQTREVSRSLLLQEKALDACDKR